MDGGGRPIGGEIGQRRNGSISIHRRDPPIQAKRLCLGGEPTVSKQCLERVVLVQKLRGTFLPDSPCARDSIRRIATKGDEVRHLRGIDSVALTYLHRTDSGRRGSTNRLQDRRMRARELERVSIRGRDEGVSPCLLLAVGARLKGRGLRYPVNDVALKYGAGVANETTDPKEAYARFADLKPVPCPHEFPSG